MQITAVDIEVTRAEDAIRRSCDGCYRASSLQSPNIDSECRRPERRQATWASTAQIPVKEAVFDRSFTTLGLAEQVLHSDPFPLALALYTEISGVKEQIPA